MRLTVSSYSLFPTLTSQKILQTLAQTVQHFCSENTGCWNPGNSGSCHHNQRLWKILNVMPTVKQDVWSVTYASLVLLLLCTERISL